MASVAAKRCFDPEKVRRYTEYIGSGDFSRDVLACRDAAVGDTAVSLSHGLDTIRLMNAAGYDLAVPGNHEFDYSADTFRSYADTADFPYICATLLDAEVLAVTVIDALKLRLQR